MNTLNNAKKVLIPLPSYGFDPSEAAITWFVLNERGISFSFATPDGERAHADKKMVTGETLGILKCALMARQDAVDAYHKMEEDPAFLKPMKYTDARQEDFDALFLPGGHDKSIREYLESTVLQKLVVSFFDAKKPVAAICHGVILAARSIDEKTGKSVLHHYRTTCLLRKQELLAYNMTRLWLGDYYLTYPETTVEDEIKSVLSNKANFLTGPNPLGRDDLKNLHKGFYVRDGNFLSARWPGDAYSFALEFQRILNKQIALETFRRKFRRIYIMDTCIHMRNYIK